MGTPVLPASALSLIMTYARRGGAACSRLSFATPLLGGGRAPWARSACQAAPWYVRFRLSARTRHPSFCVSVGVLPRWGYSCPPCRS